MPLVHNYQSTKADSSDTSKVHASRWNAYHDPHFDLGVVTVTSGAISVTVTSGSLPTCSTGDFAVIAAPVGLWYPTIAASARSTVSTGDVGTFTLGLSVPASSVGSSANALSWWVGQYRTTYGM